MAVTRIATPHHYVGVAADVKPTSEVPEGSLFFERDTGDTFIWDGTAWGVVSVTAASHEWEGVQTFQNEGLRVLDTNDSHGLIISPKSDLTADRILSLVTGDAARTVTLSGNPTLADWFDQSVKIAASPTFVNLTLSTGQVTVTGGVMAFQQATTLRTSTGDLTLDPAGHVVLTAGKHLYSDRVSWQANPLNYFIEWGATTTINVNGGVTRLTFNGDADPFIEVSGRILTGITGELRHLLGNTRTLTLADGTTIATFRKVHLAADTFEGVAGGGAETVTTAVTLDVDAPVQGSNITVSNIFAARFNGATIPGADNSYTLGTASFRWSDLRSVLINGADFGMSNGWRMVESELVPGYAQGWALFPDYWGGVNRSLWEEPALVNGRRPVFAVTEEYIEYRGRRISPEILDKLLIQGT